MIESNHVQGSPEWERDRLGVVTASAITRIVTPKTLKLSSQSAGYRAELLSEWALGYVEEGFSGNYWTERGHRYEDEARQAITAITGHPCRSTGFCWQDAAKVAGCSPDALIGDDGGAEIKCPMGRNHLSYLLAGGVPDEYRLQVQFSLWITGRDWWVFESYHPDLPPHIVTVEPDIDCMSAFDALVPEFIANLDEARARLIEMGVSNERQ